MQPSCGAGYGFLHILPLRVAGRTLIERHRDRRSEMGLDPHAFLGAHKDPCSVYVGVKCNALLLDLTQIREGKDLKTAGVCQDRPVPAHELMQTA